VKTTYTWAANSIFILHIVVALFLLLGWMWRDIQPFYLGLLVAWPLSWIFLGYCPLTKWELLLRKKFDPAINPNTEKIQYMCKKYFNTDVPSRFVYVGGITVFFILLGLSVWSTFF
jgi:hypothetical protein